MLTLLDTDTVFWLRFITDSSTQATSMPIHWNADIWLCKKCCGFVKQGKLKNPFMIDYSICREKTSIKYGYLFAFWECEFWKFSGQHLLDINTTCPRLWQQEECIFPMQKGWELQFWRPLKSCLFVERKINFLFML